MQAEYEQTEMGGREAKKGRRVKASEISSLTRLLISCSASNGQDFEGFVVVKDVKGRGLLIIEGLKVLQLLSI